MEDVLKNFEWEYDGTVGFARGEGYQGKGVSRTLFLRPNVQDIPEQLFKLKISQSSSPTKKGKLVFKYLTYRFTEEQALSDMAPGTATLETPLADLKAKLIVAMASQPGSSVSLNIGLKGKFTNLVCADQTVKLYDEDEPEFKTDNPKTTGNAPYYVKNEAQIHVKLKGAMSKEGNEYIQTTLSTTSTADEVLTMPQRGAIWKSNDGGMASAPAAAAEGVEPVW